MDTDNIYTCKICGKEFKAAGAFSTHLTFAHNISSKYYYDTYIKTNNEGVCINCGNPTKFISISKGYKKYCRECIKINSINTRKETYIKKYGVNSYSQTEEYKEKIKQTNQERYGTDYYLQTNECKIKKKQTCREKYGVDYYQQTEECKEKIKQTCKEKYGVEWYQQYNECKIKKKQTCREKYGVDNYSQSDECKEKIKQTCKEKYGVDWYSQTDEYKEKAKQTYRERYGVDSYSKTNEYKIKVKETNKKLYDAEYYQQTEECKEKIKQTCREKYGVNSYTQTDECKEKVKQTNQEKYGVNNYSQSDEYLLNLPNIQQKVYETKKKNHTFNSSKIEKQFAEYLTSNNYKFIRQYKSELYPFSCDFYLPKYNLYIEINGSWTHGKEPYNPNNKEHQEILNEWKSKGTKYYNNAIYVWTILDVKKQQIAKQNNLNYLTIYSNDIQKIIKQFNNK